MTNMDNAIIPFDSLAQWPDPDMTILEPPESPAPELPDADFNRVFGALAPWIRDAAEVKGAHPDYVALALLSTVSVVIGNTRWASPWEGWREPSILWAMLVGNPSSGKSPALDAVLDALRPLEEELHRQHQSSKQEWEEENVIAKIAESEWKVQVKNALEQGKKPSSRPVTANPGNRPVQQRIRITDATTEKIADLLSSTWRGLLMQRDELSGWLQSMDRYSSGGDRPFWLEAFGGRSYLVDRKSNPEPIRIENLIVAVLGGIQPDKLTRLLTRTDDDGLLARFLTVFPDPVAPRRPTNKLDEPFLTGIYRRLYSLQPHIDENGQRKPQYLLFDEAAQEKLSNFRVTCRIAEERAAGPMKSHIGKLPGLSVRTALVLTLLDWAATDENSADPRLITGELVERAILYVGDHLLAHAQRAYGSVALPQEIQSAMRLARRIVEQQLDEARCRTIQRWRWSGLQTAREIQMALDILIDANWLTLKQHTSLGRPPKVYEINPKVHPQSNSPTPHHRRHTMTK